MIHLTLTGYYAGKPLCGVNKQEAILKGDDFCHYMYSAGVFAHKADQICPDCKKVVDEVENDESDESLIKH